MAISVTAATDVVVLGTSPQRFAMCMDPLTLRLFAKLRPQSQAMEQWDTAAGDLKGRKVQTYQFCQLWFQYRIHTHTFLAPYQQCSLHSSSL
jgi:hypothetical protein